MEKVAVKGKEKREALANARKKLKSWGLKMPGIFPPVVLDFGRGDFSRWGHIEYWIANDEKNWYCGKFLLMFKGQTCLAHHHLKKHETFFVVKGKILMQLSGKKLTLKPGDVLPMPQKTRHTFTALTDSLILEVSLPSLKGDNIFQDKTIGVV
ncbi:MAG: cupin domain-containing protein [Candidatus Omnitrophica bacterium]|nr:cupin domain-containing protein [Candidatus Omnitrophota bacterium]